MGEMMADTARSGIGNWLAPPRFILFALLLSIAAPVAHLFIRDCALAFMAGFDLAALVFLLSCLPLLLVRDPARMREDALSNDARRIVLLVLTFVVMAAIVAAITMETGNGREHLPVETKRWIIATLAVAWLFANSVYALHYAHLAYLHGGPEGSGGIDFPGTQRPDYMDFVYFAFTLGMTFQTSDVTISDPAVRRTVTFHCLAAFFFNIGVLAFTINVVGG